MIPIAGSAYTYTYATLGELVAWIIGWDLILEYAFSNMSVSVGFAAHIDDSARVVRHPSVLKWISPAYLPTGLQDLAGNDLYAPGWHFGFNIPAFLVVMVLTVILVRGIRESARTNNILVLIKIVAILAFIFAGSQLHQAHLLASLHAQRLDRHALRRLHHLLHLHRIRFRLHRQRRVQATAARPALRHPRHARRLHAALRRRRHSCSAASCRGSSIMGDGAPVVNALKRLSLQTGSRPSALDAPRRPHRRHARHDLVDPRLPARPGARLVRHVARRPAARRLRASPSALPHARRSPPGSPDSSSASPPACSTSAPLAELSNIGTLFAFVLVSIAVLILRRKQPERHRAFRVPGGPIFPVLSIIFCIVLMMGLEVLTWERFFIWLIIGLLIYFFYSRQRSEFYRS